MSLPPFLSRGLAASATRLLSTGLGHTYTRTPMTYAARDRYSRRVGTPGTPVTGVRCRYVARAHVRKADGGEIVVVAPAVTGGTLAFITTLTLLPDDPLAVGDLVSDIRDATNGAVLLAGPATVQAVLPHAGFGPTTLRMVALEGAPVEAPK
jgi:hypothetical protein